MVYEVTLSPELAVSGDEFMDAWHEDDKTANSGTVKLAQSADELTDEDLLDGGDVLILEITNVGIDTGELYDLLTVTLHRAGASGEFAFTPINQPGGNDLLAISPADEDDA